MLMHYIEELLKQQKIMDQFANLNSIKQLMDQANWAQRIIDENSTYNMVRRIKEDAEGLSSLSSVARLIEKMDYSIPKFADMSRQAIEAAIGRTGMHDALESLDRWKTIVDQHSVFQTLERAGMQAAAKYAEQLSSVVGIAREMDYTRRMLADPSWGILAGGAMRALEQGLPAQFDAHSIYRELSERIAEIDADETMDVEKQASNYFQVIYEFLAKAVLQFGAHNLMALSELVIGLILHIHMAHSVEALRGDVISAKEQSERAVAVAERLVAKVELAIERMGPPPEPVVKWAAGKAGAIVRIAPTCGARKAGGLLPYQVVVQVDHGGKWVEVEYQDHKAGVTRLGWVMKKHLERVTPKREPGSIDLTCKD
jgi:hypothetical protein